MFAISKAPAILKTLAAWIHRGFDATATWVTQLSWWKFFLFAALALIAGSILQDELFSSEPIPEVSSKPNKRGNRANGETNILIDDTGIHFNPRNSKNRRSTVDTPSVDSEDGGSENDESSDGKVAPPEPPAQPARPAKPAKPAKPVSPFTTDESGNSVHIDLPPQISEELSNAIEEAVDDAAEQKVSRYHKQASTWFKSFVSLLVLALFATKALVGGKKRAEAETITANAAAERESMQRQLSEAKMQMMQAQVEPHFLFNTLASVEHLIQTNPPRASAMQRSLIMYLRAVLPQMRDNTLITNLGREADMVLAYLDLLKMRMEERLTVDFNVPEGLRSAAFPPMMLQSMVENAIKHGLECKPEGGTLKVLAEVVHNKLRVSVTDDGLGFGAVPSDGTGLGLPTIRERLKLLHGEQGSLQITQNHPSGVCAAIEVPYQLSKQHSD
ncbi:sensor histidine kinase [Janthinobacterium agaricidamnosum]|uniref:Histidine kinase-, DNA gyrase B-, and HSP90-like ATPase family protein n=1 Tax=Janthinobacterium agaricidamnosum NBRC 102515 = DSM 9628 TaxID=1349767 RepID=W0VAC0_9BURK|nr:histidine kinase [Janthinobacterium agaricidamnosum]CDG84530.1 histidine kinase-, DNA gyrase B-, and HSP90-like ATPase family protein [Janthinobacterium agaricidamnosum NBRC 102515 = DSM 9628]